MLKKAREFHEDTTSWTSLLTPCKRHKCKRKWSGRWRDKERMKDWPMWRSNTHTHTHTHSLTLCVYRRHVAPAVSLDNIHHGFGLLHIWWHHSHEIFIQALLAGIYTFRSLAVDFWCFCVSRSVYLLLNHPHYISPFIRVYKSCSLLASNQHVFLTYSLRYEDHPHDVSAFSAVGRTVPTRWLLVRLLSGS